MSHLSHTYCIYVKTCQAHEDPVHEVPEVVFSSKFPDPLQNYDNYNNLIFENTSSISLTMAVVRDHEAPRVREPSGNQPSSSSNSTSSSNSLRHKKKKVMKKKKITISY